MWDEWNVNHIASASPVDLIDGGSLMKKCLWDFFRTWREKKSKKGRLGIDTDVVRDSL